MKFARCCNPVPGDKIVGFITRGYGVSIHQRDCVNVPRDLDHCAEPERWVSVEWEDSVREEFKAELRVEATDRIELLADVTAQLAAMHVMIYGMQARESRDGKAEMIMTVGVNSVKHLQEVMARLQRIRGILSIDRNGV